MTFEIEIPAELMPDMTVILDIQRALDAVVCGFEPGDVELRSAWVDVLFGGEA